MNIENLKVGNWVQLKNKVSKTNDFANYIIITTINEDYVVGTYLTWVYEGAIKKFDFEEIENIIISEDIMNIISSKYENGVTLNETGCKLYCENGNNIAFCFNHAYEFEVYNDSVTKKIKTIGAKMKYVHEIQNFLSKKAS